jgi:hypothetical protein
MADLSKSLADNTYIVDTVVPFNIVSLSTINIGLVKEFTAKSSNPNEITLMFKKPEDFSSDSEIIICRRKDSFPLELYNNDPTFTSKINTSGFTDLVQVEVYRAREVIGITGVGSNGKLVDNAGAFPTNPPLTGRILRDSTSHNFRITGNTSTEIYVVGIPASGQYVVLPDFPNSNGPMITGTISNIGRSV